MTDLHRTIAFVIPFGFLFLSLWTLVAFVFDRPPGEWFWRILAALQIVLGLQIIVGIALFVAGMRPAAAGLQNYLHYAYGGLFPIVVLVVAHRAARGHRFAGIPWAAFGIAGLVIFGLTFRALQTGLGIG